MDADFVQIAGYASLAPSGHNTQPWKFHIAGDTIAVVPDFAVSLPVVDGNNRELFISLGCAVENLCIAAGRFGYAAHTTEQGGGGIVVRLVKTGLVVEDSLFGQIEKRQTNRSVYHGVKIRDEELKRLKSGWDEDTVRFRFAEIGTPFADLVTEYILKGNEIQMNDAAFKNELLAWMRFNGRQVEAARDGLSYRVFGNPPLPGLLARPVVRLFLKPGVQNRSDRKKIDSSSHFVVCTIPNDTIEAWIGLGRTLQRFLLKATEQGISYAFLNQPCEVAALASALQQKLPVDQEYPALILRIGYAEPSPCSPRRKIESSLT